MKEIDLNLVIANLENIRDTNWDHLTHFNKMVIEDALSLIEDEVITENNVSKVKDIYELGYYISQCRFKDRLLGFNDFLELVSGAGLGIVDTEQIYRRYLDADQFKAYQNDTLDMSKMRGYKRGLCDMYLQAEAYYKAFTLIFHIILDVIYPLTED